MIFTKALTIQDISMGLACVTSTKKTKAADMDKVRNILKGYDHASIFQAAQDIAAENGLQLIVGQLDNATMDKLAPNCFAFGMNSNGWICSLWIDGVVMMPPSVDKKNLEYPDVWTIIKAERIGAQ